MGIYRLIQRKGVPKKKINMSVITWSFLSNLELIFCDNGFIGAKNQKKLMSEKQFVGNVLTVDFLLTVARNINCEYHHKNTVQVLVILFYVSTLFSMSCFQSFCKDIGGIINTFLWISILFFQYCCLKAFNMLWMILPHLLFQINPNWAVNVKYKMQKVSLKYLQRFSVYIPFYFFLDQSIQEAMKICSNSANKHLGTRFLVFAVLLWVLFYCSLL